MSRKWFSVLMIVALLCSFAVLPAVANPPVDVDEGSSVAGNGASLHKEIDRVNRIDYMRLRQRQELLRAAEKANTANAKTLQAEAALLDQTGTDRVLVVLVEFAGSDVFTWTAGTTIPTDTIGSYESAWDPLGQADDAEWDQNADESDCSLIQAKLEAQLGYTLTAGQEVPFTHTGPLHNMIERPRSLDDRSGDSIWTEDFDPAWFNNFMFGNGVEISYTLQNNEVMYANFIGQSVNDYYSDLSGGVYTITGDVVGWLSVPHSTWWYGTDTCPGRRSPYEAGSRNSGGIPGAGTSRTLVQDALDAVNAVSPTLFGGTFNWADYDLNGDGVIDRLWIVHAGYGEEDGTDLLNRDPVDPTDPTRTTPAPASFYGESAMWSHSSAIPNYPVAPGVAAGAYIMMPENGGIGVFAHEYGHNLGAWDLYAYDWGETSAGFWALMCDDWTGVPIGFEPPAMDAMHLDWWGWLDPLVITDPSQVYTVTLGQASRFDDNTGPAPVYRGVKIDLPTGQVPRPVQPWQGAYYWWGGKEDQQNAAMTSAAPISLAAGAVEAKLTFDLAYEIEEEWDFLWVQVSTDGLTWNYTDTLTNANTICAHDPSWIGGGNGFPDDLCAAGIGGFSGSNGLVPVQQELDLTPYIGQNVWLRFWYMTDWATSYAGAFVDNIEVSLGSPTAKAVQKVPVTLAPTALSGMKRVAVGAEPAQPVAARPALAPLANVVQDGGFEAGTPNSYWNNDGDLGSPICDANCQSPPVAIAHTGDWAAWFGGWSSTNASWVTQTVTIPTGATTLSFWLWVDGTPGADNGLLTAKLDGNVLASFTQEDAPSYPSTYAQVSVDISAYADGGAHNLDFTGIETGTTLMGFFVDDIMLDDNILAYTTVFTDDAESGDANWTYTAPWVRAGGTTDFEHDYYLQWRNVNPNGGYDSALGEAAWRFGPANTGMLVWYTNWNYTDDEISHYLDEFPSVGPKANTLVVDSHPEPYRDPNNAWPDRETGNVTSRALMRDAPFTLVDTVDFTLTAPYVITTTPFSGRPAVSVFDDSKTYWPGVESIAPYWRTIDWDASTILPSTKAYGVQPVAYVPGSTIVCRLHGETAGWFYCPTSNASGSNPGDVNGQYGWRFELIEEGADHTWATVRIYNTLNTPLVETQTITGPGVYNFGDTCVSLDVTDQGTLTDVTVTRVLDFPTGNANGLPRYYTIEGNPGAVFTGTLSLCYTDADLIEASPVITQETGLQLYSYLSNGQWMTYTSSVDTVNNLVSAEVTHLSTWAIGAPAVNEPTAIALHAFAPRTGVTVLPLVALGLVLGLAYVVVRRRR